MGYVEFKPDKLSPAEDGLFLLKRLVEFRKNTDILVREMVDQENQLVLSHFETDLSELREYLDAKRAGQTLKRVIPCQNCVYWSPSEDSIQGRCEHHGIYPTGAWFCGDAMLKEGES